MISSSIWPIYAADVNDTLAAGGRGRYNLLGFICGSLCGTNGGLPGLAILVLGALELGGDVGDDEVKVIFVASEQLRANVRVHRRRGTKKVGNLALISQLHS
jgi:hypothetical protein